MSPVDNFTSEIYLCSYKCSDVFCFLFLKIRTSRVTSCWNHRFKHFQDFYRHGISVHLITTTTTQTIAQGIPVMVLESRGHNYHAHLHCSAHTSSLLTTHSAHRG